MLTKRHILILIHSLGGGGAERVTVNLAATWAAAGDRVTIATLAGAELISYPIANGIRILPLNIASTTRGVLGPVIANAFRIIRVRRLLREESPDIAIGMMTTSAILLAFARRRSTLTIGSERIYPPLEPIGRFWDTLRKALYGRLDVVVAQTGEVRRWILQNTGARRVEVIANSIHLPLPVREPVLNIPHIVAPPFKFILSVGRLVPQKGFQRLMDAFAHIATRHPDWRLVILGEGPLRSRLEKHAASLGIHDKVLLPGWAGNLAEWYQATDVFAMASLHEGFPNALLEAMAHGCAVVSVDCDTGPRDLIQHEVNGLIVPQNNPSALTDALERLMGDEALRTQLCKNARNVSKTYAPEKINALWQEVFDLKRPNALTTQQKK